MSANATTEAPTGRKTLAQGKERSDAALGHDFQNTSSPEGAKEGWRSVALGEIVEINPRPGSDELSDDLLASFIPMKCVEEESGQFTPLGDKKVSEVRKGYTPFRDGDVIFAKVTPCMENGKAAVLKGLTNGVGFGSTEFFALRPKGGLDAHYLFHFILQSNFRREAARNMTGAVGLRRVPKQWLEQQTIPLPAPDEQRRIVAEIEKQFTRLEAGVAALRRVQANLKRYRAAVLKAACEGQLVPTEAELQKAELRRQKDENKRAKPADSTSSFLTHTSSLYESGEALLQRILAERRKHWEESNRKSKIGNRKYREPATPDTANLPPLPEGWTWATFEQISERVTVGFVGSMKHEYVPSGVPFLRGQNVRENKFDPEGLLYVSPEFHQKLSKSAIHPGDLAVVRSGSVGVTCVIPETLPEANCSDLVLIQRPLGFVPQYGAYFMNSLAKRHVEAGKVGVALTHFNTKSVAAMVVPLPPLAEQTRIVAEVERRLSVVEELESVVSANLHRATRLRQSILQKAFTGELVKPEPAIDLATIIPPIKPEHIHKPNRHFARALLSAEIVHRLHNEPTFGRIKHQKIFHLCEHIAQIEEIEGQYHRELAGPLDNKLIYANEAELKKQKWYQEVHRQSFGHAYEPMAKAGVHRKYVEGYWPDKLPIIEKLIELMRTWDTDRCEIFCTAYAAWNDLLLWGKDATDAAILHEILNRWHDSKRRFPQERWLKAIHWMKEKGFVPTGFGKPTSKPA